MNFRLQLFVLLSCLILASCGSKNFPFGDDKYETVVHQGELYLVNMRTGEIARVQGNDLQRIRLTRSNALSPRQHSLRFDHKFGSKRVFQIEGIVKQIGNTVKIRGTAKPYILDLDTPNSEGAIFFISFEETDRFEIGNIAISTSDLRTSIGESGSPEAFSFQKDVLMPIDQFKETTATEVIWFPELDAAVEEWLKTDDGLEYSAKQTEESPEENTQPSETEAE